MKRAYRRYMKEVKFKKRVKTWTQGTYTWNPQLREEWIKEIFEGKASTFLRTTGRPCNCWMCSGENKYERPKNQDVQKYIWEQIEDDKDMHL